MDDLLNKHVAKPQLHPEIGEREHVDERQEALIRAALDEQEAQKQQKRATKEAPKVKGKTLAEIEAEEGGPVKESLIGMAHVKRAKNRKGVAGAEDAAPPGLDALPPDALEEVGVGEAELQRFEEGDEDAKDEGDVVIEPFNLKREREAGHFDDEGNYVERKADKDEVRDAWLDSDEAKVVSEQVRKQLAEREAAMTAAVNERRVPLTDRQIAQKKAEMAGAMEAGETVVRALKRLGAGRGGAGGAEGKALGRRERERLQRLAAEQQNGAGGKGGQSSGGGGGGEGDQAAFDRLTELADGLLAEGETDIYSNTKEELARSAEMWLPREPPAKRPAVAAAGSGAPASAGPSAAAGGKDDEDDDMFAEEDGEKNDGPAAGAAAAAAAEPGPGAGGAEQQQQQRGGPAGSSGGGGGSDETDFGSWPIKELKRFLGERGQDVGSVVEKGELVALAKKVASQPPQGATDASAAAAFTAPAGYAFDPSSGYFFNTETGMYYDTKSGGFCQAATGKWFTYDSANKQFVEWQGSR